jgi:predicted nucleic acid-binding protein
MAVFVDTSAFLAVINAADDEHMRASETWANLLAAGEPSIASNYTLVQTTTILQRRRGMEPVRRFQDSIVPLPRIIWVAPDIHDRSVTMLLAAGRRQLSLVDCVSFVLIQQYDVERAFASDRHFDRQGLQVIP